MHTIHKEEFSDFSNEYSLTSILYSRYRSFFMSQSQLVSFVTQYLQQLRLQRGASEHTVTAYQNDLEHFISFIEKNYEIEHPESLKPLHIRSWLADMMSDEQSKLKPSSIKRKKSAVQSFLRYLIYQKIISSNPASAVPTPRTAKRLPISVGAECVETLVNLDKNPTSQVATWQALNEQLIVKLLFETGMRRAELVQLEIPDIDFSRCSISVWGKGNKQRIIPLHHNTLKEIGEYIQMRQKEFGTAEGTLLVTPKGKPVGDKYIYRVCKTFLTKYSTASKKSPHIMRHTFATELLNNGADVIAIKELLGHQSLAATQIYTHTQIENLKKEFRKSHPRS